MNGVNVAALFALVDRIRPLPSWDELARHAGVDPPRSRPGDLFCEDVDLQAYWPAVRACWGAG